MNTLAKLLKGNAIRDRFDRHYSGDFKTGCIGCGTDIDANFVCQSVLGDIKGIVARAVRHGYSQDDAEKIWMIIRGPHCLDCYGLLHTADVSGPPPPSPKNRSAFANWLLGERGN